MSKGKLKEVPMVGELVNAEITKEQLDKALELQKKEMTSTGARSFILDLLAEQATEISKVAGGRQFTAIDVKKWKDKALSKQAVMKSEAAEYDTKELKNIDADSLKIDEGWMYRARTEDKPNPSTSAIAVANIADLTVRLAKEGLGKGQEVSDTVKKGVRRASGLVQALTGQDESVLGGKKPGDLLQSVRDGLKDAAKSAGKSENIKNFNDDYFKNVLAGLSLTNEEKQIRDKVIKRMYSKVEKHELSTKSFEKLVKKLTINEGKEDYVKVKNVKALHEGYARGYDKKEQERKEQKGSQALSR